MPLLLYKSLLNAEVAVWKATEEIGFYADFLAEHHFPTDRANGINHPEKIRQWYASRYLLCEIFPGAIQSYVNRKPVLLNGPEISFSHSGDVVAVMLSKFKTGIDVQKRDAKLEIIAERFVNPDDLILFDGYDKLTMLGKIWAIKEAVFKLYVTELPFKDIHLVSINPAHTAVKVKVKKQGHSAIHELALLQVENMALAYVLE